MSAEPARWTQPRSCPTCNSHLEVRTLGCGRCGTEVNGAFQPCALCALPPDERELIEAFLAARGRVKSIQEHLGVSYPTARARLEAALEAMGVGPAASGDPYRKTLADLAAGGVTIDEAAQRLRGARSASAAS